jgi:predicted nucleic-acid-binding protein
MIGLDTNILVRYLVQDEPDQARRATRLIEHASRSDERFFVNPIVLCELVWVLESAYDFSRADVADTLDTLFRAAAFEVGEKDAAWWALACYRAGRADFADCLIGRLNSRAGCERTMTFDAALKTVAGFAVA